MKKRFDLLEGASRTIGHMQQRAQIRKDAKQKCKQISRDWIDGNISLSEAFAKTKNVKTREVANIALNMLESFEDNIRN